jgi:signal transduction histidine kinase
MRRRLRSVSVRIALLGLAIAILVTGVLVGGVLVIGRSTFEELMALHGTTAALSYEMFDQSVTRVVIVAALIALTGGLVLALIVARMIERPLAEVAEAARGIASGGYDIRVTRPDTQELASLADSFNQMAASLQDQQRQRRDLILSFAHELRTPLTNLHGYLTAMRDGIVSADTHAFVSLQEEVDRLHRLSRSLDALADGDSSGQAPVDMDMVPILTALVELHQPVFGRRGLRLETHLPSRLRARADADALAQVVGNLLQNAGRYTPDGGLVWLRARAEPDSVLVSVANTGDGIPAEDLPHIFERFYRVDKSRAVARGGAGIGLALVKDLVEAAGGKVGVDSRPGLTRFWFSLPA